MSVVVLSSHWAGARIGQAREQRREFPQTDNSTPDQNKDTPGRVHGQPSSSAHSSVAIKRLLSLTRATARAGSDFEWSEQVAKVLAATSAAELAEIYAAIEPGLDNDLAALKREILEAWMEKDHEAALLASFHSNESKNPGVELTIGYGNWAADHPEEALDWLRSESLPDELRPFAKRMRNRFLGDLINRNFDLAANEYHRMSQADAADLLRDWGTTQASKPELRERLLNLVKSSDRPEDFEALAEPLALSWSSKDLEGMHAYFENAPLSDSSKNAVDAAETFTRSNGKEGENKAQAMDFWMSRHSENPETTPLIGQVITGWITNSPEEARQWLASQPESPQRDAIYAGATPALANAKRFSDAAELIGAIHDPDLQRQSAERLGVLWSESDADAAANWRAAFQPQQGRK